MLQLPREGLSQTEDAKADLSFVDTFANLDLRRWFVSDGWTNGDHQGCTWSDDNVKIKDGALELTLSPDPAKADQYLCGELQSRAFFGYGTYEIRMQAAAGPGLVSSMFTYTGPTHGNPHDEIDLEFLGKSTEAVQLNFYVGGQGGHESINALGFDASTTMADYAFEWLPDRLRWFVNGNLVREEVRAADKPFPTTMSKLYVSLWNGRGRNSDAWLRPFAYPGSPLVARYERIAFTSAGTPCQFPDSVVCKRAGK